MLILTRKINQQIRIGKDVVLTVVKTTRNAVRIGIEAPRDKTILRAELKEGKRE